MECDGADGVCVCVPVQQHGAVLCAQAEADGTKVQHPRADRHRRDGGMTCLRLCLHLVVCSCPFIGLKVQENAKQNVPHTFTISGKQRSLELQAR